MRFSKHIIPAALLGMAVQFAAIPENACAQEPVTALWKRESFAVKGSFTRHLDSLTGAYQQAWNESFETHLENGTLQARLDSLREIFPGRIGPLPEKTPLNAKVTGIIPKDGYSVEKVIFESRPSYYVTALLFVPDPERYSPPHPGVLVPCGHAEPAKGHDEYQAMGALCALNGMAALVFDPIDQGERHQLLDEDGKPLNWGTRSHNMEGIRATLLGQHMAGYFTWDGIRALDYLASRKEVDADRIGISGNSGGGTQTTYLFAADERLKAAAPSCFIHTVFTQARLEMGDAEQNVFGQIRDGLDHADYVMMCAPRPHKTLAATHDFFRIYATWDTYRYTKRYYTSLGYSERVDIMENNEGHNYNRQQREAAVQWMLRWLAGRDEVVREPQIELLTPDEYTVTTQGSVLDLPGAVSINDLFMEEMEKAGEQRRKFLRQNSDSVLAHKVRELTGMNMLPEGRLRVISRIESQPDGYSSTEYTFASGDGYTFHATCYRPDNSHEETPVLFLSEGGTSFHLGEILRMVEGGQSVISLELPGTGSLRQDGKKNLRLSSGMSWEDCNKAYLMGRSVVGYRIRDILDVSGFLAGQRKGSGSVMIHAVGETGIPAIHAAFLESQFIESLTVSGTVSSWEEVVRSKTSHNQLVNVVHGVLNWYDLPDLVNRLGGRVTLTGPVTAAGVPVNGRQRAEMEQTWRGQDE